MPAFSLPLGVPPLLPSGYIDFNPSPPLLFNDEVGIFSAPLSGQWGIFLNGSPVITPDTVVDFNYKRDSLLSDYPIEGGGFQTYDKVQIPRDLRVRMAVGADEPTRQNFLLTLESIAGDLNLYTIITPEMSYPSVNITHIDFRRSSGEGVGMIVADIWFLEIRVTASAQFSNTAQPSGADAENGGQVQPQNAATAVPQVT